MKKDFTEEEKDKIWELYSKCSRQAVADYLGIRYNSVGHVLKNLGFYDRKKEAYSIRANQPKIENLFLVDTPKKYYLIGYILGDGSLCVKQSLNDISLVLSSSDYSYISSLRDAFDPNLQISGPLKGNYRVSITDRPICKWLLSYGIGLKKSKLGCSLKGIPEEFKYEFLAGLMDSDGGIYFLNKGKGLTVRWYGHISYMDLILNLLESYEPNYTKVDSNLFAVYLYKQANVMKFLDVMYSKTPIKLNRKYERYKDFKRRLEL